MADDFYPFVDSGDEVTSNHHITDAQRTPFAQGAPASPQGTAASPQDGPDMVQYPARIAVYDDLLSTPRVIVIEPKDIRSYLEEITNTVNSCVREQGGKIPFMVIREIVENFIHASFIEPTVSILDGGNTLRFADQGPGIANKKLALEAGMTSANEYMKRYIRGVGSGFPTVQQYLQMAGGRLTIEDNMNKGTVVTVTLAGDKNDAAETGGDGQAAAGAYGSMAPGGAAAYGVPGAPAAPYGTYPQAAIPAQENVPTGGEAPSGATNPSAPGYAPSAYPPAGAAGQTAAGADAPAAGYTAGAYPQGPATGQGAQTAGYGPYGASPYGGAPGYYPGYAPYGAAYPAQPNPQGGWGYPPNYGFPQSYPQSGRMFSTGPQPAVSPQNAPGGAAGADGPYISERGHLALHFMQEHGSCGPTELARTYGSSNPTWSRELATLAETGLVIKRGQKYLLTTLGASYAAGEAAAQ